jgi:hypothetical protein
MYNGCGQKTICGAMLSFSMALLQWMRAACRLTATHVAAHGRV